MARDLCDDVRRGAESIDTDSPGIAGHLQRSIPNQAGAEQGGRVLIVVRRRHAETKPGIRNGILCVASIDLISRESCGAAQILAGRATELTHPARMPQPRNAHAVPGHKALNVGADLFDSTDNLVTWDNWNGRRWQLSVNDVQIGTTHATGEDCHEQLVRTRRWNLDLDRFDAAQAGLGQCHRAHVLQGGPRLQTVQPPRHSRAEISLGSW
jgi:hypothetical protein